MWPSLSPQGMLLHVLWLAPYCYVGQTRLLRSLRSLSETLWSTEDDIFLRCLWINFTFMENEESVEDPFAPQ